MLQYMKHKDHGTHIAYSQDEVERNEAHGWVCVDHPHDDPFAETEINDWHDVSLDRLWLEGKPLSELKDMASDLGIKIHPRAKENSIIQKILDAE